ncbi:aldehyde dehydrogenase [Nocardia sp. CA-120079]|uniref:aldehyde dehydrogenase n=1 Tax=Nocardia sp. CA-120079 TaxID=3239974 RepID=UPI003D98DF94
MTTEDNAVTARVDGVEVATGHFIGGKRRDSTEVFEVHSPIDGKHLANVSRGTAADIDDAVAAAKAAFPAWAALGPEGRYPYLIRFAELILEHRDELATVETADVGMGLQMTRTHMVDRSSRNIRFFADLALKINDRVIDSPEVTNYVRFDPSGVSALITPWNGPLMLTTWKIGPCLAAGNTAVVKPPEWAPLTCSLLADLIAEAGIPDGVVNFVQGFGAEAGQALVEHKDIRRISFTGSPQTAKTIARAAADRLVPTSFELGGKSPNIVFADADLDLAVNHAVVAFRSGGQGCTNGTRLLVEESIAEEFERRLTETAAKMAVGDPRDPATQLGPLIHPVHRDRVQGFVDRAVEDGAEIAWGGGTFDQGELFYKPTLVKNIRRGMEIEQREVFGPVVTWQTFRTEDEAIDLANSTEYGLSSEVFTQSEERAMRMAARIRSGMVWVNCYMVRELAAPFGGLGLSGIGREGGEWSFDFYCDIKNIAVRKESLPRD